MNTTQLAYRVLARSDILAPNSNFRVGGFNRDIAVMLIQATIEILNEEGLLSGCMLCRNERLDKENG